MNILLLLSKIPLSLSLSLIESPILSSGFVDNEITSICRLEQMKELNTLGMIS